MTSGMQTRTRLARLHAYPAMVEDSLAFELAQGHVATGSRVLDPFCGSGRLLVAGASRVGQFLGIDVNPLACLIARAKTVNADRTIVKNIIRDLRCAKKNSVCLDICWREHRKVDWYSQTAKRELSEIIGWINALTLGEAEKVVVAVALSAAARKASYCRNGRWKLHRMTEGQRAVHTCSPWDVFEKSLRYYCDSVSTDLPLLGEVEIVCGEASNVLAARCQQGSLLPADLILTSPPYGDSKSTVQYGAASALCLDVVSQLNGLEEFYAPGAEIDARCLGGRLGRIRDVERLRELRRYWAGSRDSQHARRVANYLADFGGVLQSLSSALNPKGKLVLILGRRSVGGYRLKIDVFAADCLGEKHFVVDSKERRKFIQKRMPRTINRFGRAANVELRKIGTTKTMDEEIILVLSRKQ